MDIDDLTIGQVKEINSLIGKEKSDLQPYKIGDNWFFRTVTHHLIGVVKAVGEKEILLEGGTVMWVADDGRFESLFTNGTPSETEPYGNGEDVVVGRGSIIDGCKYRLIEVKQR